MIQFLEELHLQVTQALQIGKEFARGRKFKPISRILFCGLGGSAISGDILRRLAFRNEKYPFLVFRTAQIPKWVDRHTLVILSSYSGNTEEVIEAFKQARRIGAQLLIVTSGGKLGALAKKAKIPFIQIPAGLPPRCAVGYLSFAPVPMLRKSRVIQVSDAEIKEVISILKKPPRAKARTIAKQLMGRTVRFYGITGILDPALVRWKAQFAENSKIIVSSCVLPEMFHNEIEGWQFPRKVIRNSTAVFFMDRDDLKSIDSKRRVAKRFIQKQGAKVLDIRPQGKLPLSRIFSLIYLGDWVSYELALLHKVDPLKIPAIDAIKKV